MMQWLLWGLFACGPKQNYVPYTIQRPEGGWRRVQEGGADYAWYNRTLSSVIYVDSSCHKKFEDRELRDSIQSLTQGISKDGPLSAAEIAIDDRMGRLEIHKGALDGVSVQLGVASLSKNECLYDFVLIAPPSQFDNGLNSFLDFLNTFQTVESEGFRKVQNPDEFK